MTICLATSRPLMGCRSGTRCVAAAACSVYPPWWANTFGVQFTAERMEPKGCERHRWVKLRGREERERISQSAVADESPARHSLGDGGTWRQPLSGCKRSV